MRATSARFIRRMVLITTALVISALAAASQTPPAPAPNTQKPGMAPRPPLLFSEPWQLPPYKGEQTDENMRFTMKGILSRAPSLAIRTVSYDLYVHPQRDPARAAA